MIGFKYARNGQITECLRLNIQILASLGLRITRKTLSEIVRKV